MIQLAPPALLRLSVETQSQFLAYKQANAKMLTQIWLWRETLGNSEQPVRFSGICDICDSQTNFVATSAKAAEGYRFAFRTNWWSTTNCEACALSNLDRAVVHIFRNGGGPQDRIYHVGYHSPFRQWLSKAFPDVTASQYDPSRRSGEVSNGIRYEDLTALSFSERAFDCVVAMEVLEHIPNYQSALREMARVLKPGGRALLSFPWMGGEHYDHFVRAEMRSDGSIHHIHEPEYHKDPAQPGGILSFRNFGWKILDEMRDAGFRRASAEYVFSPLYGYMSPDNPVIVGLR